MYKMYIVGINWGINRKMFKKLIGQIYLVNEKKEIK